MSEGSTVNLSNEGEGPAFGPGPYSSGEIRILNLLLDIKEKMGGTGHATMVLEDASKTVDERLLEVIRAADKTASGIPIMQDAIAQHAKDLNELGRRHDKDLNELGRRVDKDLNELGRRLGNEIKELEKFEHTAKTFGAVTLSLIGVAAVVLGYFFHYFVGK
jgi:hypothetical protein